MGFQVAGNFQQLLPHLGGFLGESLQRLGSADTGHHIFALGVGEVVAHRHFGAGVVVAGESYSGATIVAHVAKNHRLHGDGGAQVVGDLFFIAVDHGARIPPAAEDGFDREAELLENAVGELAVGFGLELGLELTDQLFEGGGGDEAVFGDVEFFFLLLQ